MTHALSTNAQVRATIGYERKRQRGMHGMRRPSRHAPAEDPMPGDDARVGSRRTDTGATDTTSAAAVTETRSGVESAADEGDLGCQRGRDDGRESDMDP